MPEQRRTRPSPATLALGGAAALVAIGYPLVAARALHAYGPRQVGAAVLGLGVLSYASSLRRRVPGLGPWLRALPLLLPALAIVTGEVRFLKLVPAAIECILCAVFLASLRGGGSVLQEAARMLEPHAPEFIGPYCRKATAAFAGLFALQAVVLTAVGLGSTGAAADPVWAARASLLVWVPTVVGTTGEFLVRKIWFRHYGRSPVDRVLRVLLPPENTEQGRRSLAYVRRMRRELGLPPP